MLLRILHRMLEQPVVFDTYQWLIGAPACHRAFVRDWVKPLPGERVLDLGCGVGASLRYMPPGVDYTGLDINSDYIEEARRRYRDRGRFLVGDVTDFKMEAGESFDRAMAFGVLHHLDDSTASSLLELARKLCRHGAELVMIEPAYVQGQSAIGRWLIDRDRGRHVRSVESYRSLISPFGDIDVSVVHDLLNIPYTQVIIHLYLK